ncbi:MAG TPA: biotin/lipoyl-containing protein [Thermoanaerobaculia bacterium]
MSKSFLFGPSGSEITVRGKAPRYEVARDGRSESVEARSLPDGRLSLLFADGRQVSGRARRRGGQEVEISTPCGRRRFMVTDPLRARLSSVQEHAGSGGPETEEVRALMPGRVVDVSVAAGDSVEAGGLLLVLEAMKMQNELRATYAGVVLQCAIAAGQTVDAGALLLTIQPSR